jgi:phosphatidylinositol-bisphosphatase
MMVFVKESVKNNITNLTGTIVKTGFLGTLGNKGNVIVRFDFNNVSFAFSCCHLTSDLPKNEARIKELNDILTKSVLISNTKEMKFREHNIQFVFGDLNFRIELENSMCRQMIKNGNLENLTVYDQFLKARSMNPLFFELDEGPLDFNPTYKYDFNSDEYDSSKKKRVPAWCDRILWRKNKSIQLIEYDIANYTYSDHRPVYGLYNISTQGKDLEANNKHEFKVDNSKAYLILEPGHTHSTNNLKQHNVVDQKAPSHNRSNSVSASEGKNANLIDLNFTPSNQAQSKQQQNISIIYT